MLIPLPICLLAAVSAVGAVQSFSLEAYFKTKYPQLWEAGNLTHFPRALGDGSCYYYIISHTSTNEQLRNDTILARKVRALRVTSYVFAAFSIWLIVWLLLLAGRNPS